MMAQLVGTWMEVGPVRLTVAEVEMAEVTNERAFADAVTMKVRVALETDLPGSLTTLTWPA